MPYNRGMRTRSRVARCCCQTTVLRAPFVVSYPGSSQSITDGATLHPDAFTFSGSGWNHSINDNMGSLYYLYGLQTSPYIFPPAGYLSRLYTFNTILTPVPAAPGATVTQAVLRLTATPTPGFPPPPMTVHCWVSTRCFSFNPVGPVVTPDPIPYGPPDGLGIRHAPPPWTVYGNDPDDWDAINGPWLPRVTTSFALDYSIDITSQINTFLTTANPDPYALFLLAVDHPSSVKWNHPIELDGRLADCPPIPAPPVDMRNFLEITL